MTTSASEYVAEIEAWRRRIDEGVRRDWVSLVSRFELTPGSYRLGSAADATIQLPAPAAPPLLGELVVAADGVTLTPAPGVELLLNDEPASGTIVLRSDAESDPDVIAIGSLSFFVIQRGPRTILRSRDAESPAVRRFVGRRWFPLAEAMIVEAAFTPYDPPKPVAIANILGDLADDASPGFVSFVLGGEQFTLEATPGYNGGLTLHFRDTTNGDSTYGAGRVISAPAPVNGLVTVDFNRAANLPCAFTEFATCPLPLPQNRLPIAITAGELLPDLG